jgi:hypothetical protein
MIVLAIAGGMWHYLGRGNRTSIEKILSRPSEYQRKAITIEGEVTDRTAFFVVLTSFKLRDRTGEITIVTRRSLPEMRLTVSVKSKIDDAFPIGDQKLLMFMEESIEKKDWDK